MVRGKVMQDLENEPQHSSRIKTFIMMDKLLSYLELQC